MDYLGSRTTAEGNVVHSFVNYGDKVAPASAQGVVGADYVRDIMTQARANSNANMAWSANQAAHQMNFQRQMQQDAMRFNAAEAAKNRDWQQYMSNTAFQRQMADLKAAGLNPVLAAGGGNGAPVTSGATAAGVQGASGASGQIDSSGNAAVASILGSWISSLTALENQRVSAQTALAETDKINAMTKYVEEMKNATNLFIHADQMTYQYYALGVQDALQRYIADNDLERTKISAGAQIAYGKLMNEASHYSADKTFQTAELNRKLEKELTENGWKIDMVRDFMGYMNNARLEDLKHGHTLEQMAEQHQYTKEENTARNFTDLISSFTRAAALSGMLGG